MCGICGELRFDGEPAELAVIQRMSVRLVRRGPDHAGRFSDGPLAFGHRRLAIIDLSEQANQPMFDPQLGLVLVFNGAIYNYRALRETLIAKGYCFFSTGDTEVILKAWHAWGEASVERLEGMFAFAIWDQQQRRLTLVRDRLGIKPFYYTLDQRGLRFASNTQALLVAGGVDTSIDPLALHYQFTLHGVVPAPHTIFNGIRKLAPGHVMRVSEAGAGPQYAYWSYPVDRPAVPRSEGEWLEVIEVALRQAVRRRSQVADVPVAVLLSGGLDSSLLVALLGEAGVSDLHTFTIGFEDQPEEQGNEFEYSDAVAEHCATRHQRFLVSDAEVLRRLPEAVEQMAEPMFGQDAVAFYLLAEQVAKQFKVVQSGQGADEVFGGYAWYPRMLADSHGDPVARFARHYFDRDHGEYLRLITPRLAGADHSRALIGDYLQDVADEDFMQAVLRMDQTMLLVDDPLKRVDNMTMAWGLEARVPFLDQQLLELMAACPAELKLREAGKYPLKAVARGRLPDSVIDRPKGYFPLPALKYVRGEFLTFVRDILDSSVACERGLFQRKYVEMLLAAPQMHHTRLWGSKIWQLAVFELWLQRQGV
ncbi:N-acetylglutaminylglutamine amidotransferase [endosymbiont of Riftia pachyptila]|nr:N-acetylglutaminylglutamine amidotransferase [endosymbiont of Riftia pachyptila]